MSEKALKVSHSESGDHLGLFALEPKLVKRRQPVPSRRIVWGSWMLEAVSRPKAIRVPSGAQAGRTVSTVPPLHTSLAPPANRVETLVNALPSKSPNRTCWSKVAAPLNVSVDPSGEMSGCT